MDASQRLIAAWNESKLERCHYGDIRDFGCIYVYCASRRFEPDSEDDHQWFADVDRSSSAADELDRRAWWTKRGDPHVDSQQLIGCCRVQGLQRNFLRQLHNGDRHRQCYWLHGYAGHRLVVLRRKRRK